MDPLHTLLRLYGATWRLATPLLRRHKRLRAGFEERLVPDGWPFAEAEASHTPAPLPASAPAPHPCGPQPRGPVIWIQAASGGEAKLVHSLVRALAEALGTQPAPSGNDAALSPSPPTGLRLTLLCTTCTTQGLEVLQALPPEPSPHLRVVPRFFPLDRPDLMERAMRQAAPTGVVLLETELWPGFLVAAAQAGVPVFMYNARMTEKSASGYAWLRSFWEKYAPKLVLATAQADVQRFSALFGRARVGLMHNMKFDGAAAALQQANSGAHEPALRRGMGLPPTAPDCLLAAFASVREQEESLLLPVLRRLQESTACAHIVVAPRHLTRIPHWHTYAKQLGLPVALRSTLLQEASQTTEAAPTPGGPRLILWDTFGDLHALYTLADVAFVGGSLAPLGGQNFLEALEAGLTPCIGPHWDNFLWVGDTLMQQDLVHVCSGAEDLGLVLEQACAALKAHPPATWQQQRSATRARVQQQFSLWLTARTGGSRQAAESLLKETGLLRTNAG